MRVRVVLVSWLLIVLAGFGLVPPASNAWATPVAAAQSLGGQPIWANGSAATGSVALFRQRFTLASNATELQLAIFADTRYEAYLNGQLLGRGPARFSRVRQEFDTLPVPPLGPGTHVLAVLVQHAPDTRRAEGIRAGVQAELRGQVGDQAVVVTATDGNWRALVTPAWNSKARWISNLGLIGPQELLDLRQLPADWTRPRFDDATWPFAVPLLPAPYTNLVPRSIPLLAHTPHAPLRVVEAGLLSPGMQLLDLEHEAGAQREVTLRAGRNALLRLEATLTTTVLLNDRPIKGWQALNDPRRPDVFAVEQQLAPGLYRLLIDVPPMGRALAIGGKGVTVEQAPPLVQRPQRDDQPGRQRCYHSRWAVWPLHRARSWAHDAWAGTGRRDRASRHAGRGRVGRAFIAQPPHACPRLAAQKPVAANRLVGARRRAAHADDDRCAGRALPADQRIWRGAGAGAELAGDRGTLSRGAHRQLSLF
jgi:hypothetical protein